MAIDYDAHNWWDHFFQIRGSMVREITYRVLACVTWAAGVTLVHKTCMPLSISSSAHSLIGLAIGLLLVFRTNSSYDRFWEGRKLWGAIVNESRNLARLATVLLAREPVLLRRLLEWLVAFPWASMHYLRGAKSLGPNASLPTDEVAAVLAIQQVPLAVARKVTESINRAREQQVISDYLAGTLDASVQQLVACMGGCERIHRTPLPFSYVVHLRRVLILYCFTLPFALLKDFDWWTILATLIVSYTLYGIEEIGVEIEDPFGEDANDLPLDRICTTIEENVRSLAP